RERRHGFTIIELLIVIAIIAILAAVAIPALLRAQESGKESAALQVLKSLRNAEETFKVRSPAKKYGTLAELKAANYITVDEDGVEKASGYTFAMEVPPDEDTYTITAIPPAGKKMLSFTLTADGEIKQNMVTP
ncbi:MAG: prepilin-type N-terminal cleavage/methylation domain-containing protein, partial [Armatimonadetes bacterium]|nr:prepilin-type N-terminal cleavage/methylation domain-containing protein [Armatimonadota bacterium]